MQVSFWNIMEIRQLLIEMLPATKCFTNSIQWRMIQYVMMEDLRIFLEEYHAHLASYVQMKITLRMFLKIFNSIFVWRTWANQDFGTLV